MENMTYNKIDAESNNFLGLSQSLLAMIDKIEQAEDWLIDNYSITLKEGAKLPKVQRDRINKEYKLYLKNI